MAKAAQKQGTECVMGTVRTGGECAPWVTFHSGCPLGRLLRRVSTASRVISVTWVCREVTGTDKAGPQPGGTFLGRLSAVPGIHQGERSLLGPGKQLLRSVCVLAD